MITAKKNSIVCIHLTGKTREGFVFTQTEAKNPITFEIGDPNILKWLQDVVIDMVVGETKTIELSPQEGFGEHYDKLVTKFDKTVFPKNLKLEVDQYYKLQEPDGSGKTYAVRIVDINKNEVYLDTNHPLAGQPLFFEIFLIKKTTA